ncbi:MAG TPA: biopolymer transporter ExbD [Candidatus Acidoferrum sp.]
MKEEVFFMDREGVPVWSPSQAAAQREAKRRPRFYSYLNLWPFVAVLVVLLCIFMVNAPPFHHITLDLPGSFCATEQPKARAEDAMKIYVMRDGRVYFRNYRAEPKSLPFLIHNAMQEGAEKKVYLSVVSRARYGDAAPVVEEISNAGIREICILAYKREK